MVLIEETTLHITRGDETTGKFNRLAFYVPIYNGIEEEKYKFQKLKLENYLDLPEIDREKFHGIHYDQIKLF